MSFRSVLKGINPDRPLIELNENTIITSANLLKSLKKAKRNLEALGIKKIIIGHEANFENLYLTTFSKNIIFFHLFLCSLFMF